MSLIEFDINQEHVCIDSTGQERLLDCLRARGHTDVKEGCGSGECGACTVILNDEPVCSCLTFTLQAEGGQVLTASHLAAELPELIAALEQHSAVQCGFCTPGIVVSASKLLLSSPAPNPDKIATALEGHLCRCTGYHRISRAVSAAIRKRRETGQLAPYQAGALTRTGRQPT